MTQYKKSSALEEEPIELDNTNQIESWSFPEKNLIFWKAFS